MTSNRRRDTTSANAPDGTSSTNETRVQIANSEEIWATDRPESRNSSA